MSKMQQALEAMVQLTPEELQDVQRLLDERARAIQKQLMESVKPVFEFTIRRTPASQWNRVFHCDYVLYTVARTTLNVDECDAVGRPSYETASGSMPYFYDTKDGNLIGSSGGGSYYFTRAETAAAISEFLRENPEGGDITHLLR